MPTPSPAAEFIEHDEFRELLEQVRAGSQEAGWTIVELYGHHILRVVRRTMTREMRVAFDSGDFVQAVWASFFEAAPRLESFQSPENLISFLTTIAKRRVIDAFRRRHVYQKQAAKNEVRIDSAEDLVIARAVRRQPTPSDFAIARERWTQLLSSHPPQYQAMLQMKYQGASYEEIGEQLGVSSRTVRRAIDKMLWLQPIGSAD